MISLVSEIIARRWIQNISTDILSPSPKGRREYARLANLPLLRSRWFRLDQRERGFLFRGRLSLDHRLAGRCLQALFERRHNVEARYVFNLLEFGNLLALNLRIDQFAQSLVIMIDRVD